MPPWSTHDLVLDLPLVLDAAPTAGACGVEPALHRLEREHGCASLRGVTVELKPVVKADLAAAVHEHLQLTKRDSIMAVDAVIEAMAKALTDGHELRLSNFGRFTLRGHQARPGRNPKTGEPVEIKARTVVLFRPAEALKEAVASIAPKNTPAK